MMYQKLKPALTRQLATLRLRYVFSESGRATAYIKNEYLHGNVAARAKNLEVMFSMLDEEKIALKTAPGLTFKGIDFERGAMLQMAVAHLFRETNTERMPLTTALLQQISDPSLPQLSFKQFKRAYEQLQQHFFADSARIRMETGNIYPQLAYLLSNPNMNTPASNRNVAMARNLVAEIDDADTTQIFFLSIGIAHAIVTNKRSALYHITQDPFFHGKTLVMNVFCEHCTAGGIPVDDRRLGYMLGSIGECFSNCANSSMTLFDLRDLPAEYDDLKAYGDLVFYAKDQH